MTARLFLLKLIRVGSIPKKYADVLQSEGIELAEQRIAGSINLRNYRAPGKFHSQKHSVFLGSIVITKQRLAAFAYNKPVINVPLTDARIKDLYIYSDHRNRVIFKFDVEIFHPERSGTIECKFSTKETQAFMDKLHGIISSFE